MCNVLSWIIVKNCIGACIRNCFMFKVGLGSLHTQVTNDWPGPKNSQVSKLDTFNLILFLFCYLLIYGFKMNVRTVWSSLGSLTMILFTLIFKVYANGWIVFIRKLMGTHNIWVFYFVKTEYHKQRSFRFKVHTFVCTLKYQVTWIW